MSTKKVRSDRGKSNGKGNGKGKGKVAEYVWNIRMRGCQTPGCGHMRWRHGPHVGACRVVVNKGLGGGGPGQVYEKDKSTLCPCKDYAGWDK